MGMIRRLTDEDYPRVRQFWKKLWHAEEIIIHGQVIHPEEVEGFVYADWLGLVTFRYQDGECEIISLNSFQKRQGIGTVLTEAVIGEARARNCQRLYLVTTNDNLQALGFYQKRGFCLVAVYPGAVNESRKLKPAIPLIGQLGIPLRDEIELELKLS